MTRHCFSRRLAAAAAHAMTSDLAIRLESSFA